MTFSSTTTYADSSRGQAAIQNGRKRGDTGTAPRKHFLDAYAEHLNALKRDRSTK
jgi:hypothetical protein